LELTTATQLLSRFELSKKWSDDSFPEKCCAWANLSKEASFSRFFEQTEVRPATLLLSASNVAQWKESTELRYGWL